ncbi:helicase protein [Teladorsagia circumcincta]|uniref:RNA helicase n=1 Tax=Teladorsagia circumcincta TaxID=45464 RepID=A0A2G9UTJ5_TELCI|nr:helicase protein [Teladorsagia circumcincta]
MTITNQVLYDPSAPLPNADDSNQLVILPGKKRKVQDEGPLPKKKSATGGKKGKNFIKEKEKQKLTKKKKRQLAAVQQRKANKLTQEELFASLAEYQLEPKKLNQLASSSHMQDKIKSAHNGNDGDIDSFPSRIKVCSSKVKLPPTIHQKGRTQENYYPTDDEDSDESEIGGNEVEVCDSSPSSSSARLETATIDEAEVEVESGATEKDCATVVAEDSSTTAQIRYEGNRTPQTKILFMTDGVLMKEMESDVMLKKYSAILIDEAHERSMYSDVLIGMLSRIAPLRAKTSNPLKLIIMSATLRLADFTHKRLFPILEPKVINVESRQFPVTVHFEKRTPDDYMMATFRKVCRIHEALPDGAILVFVSGQQEVRHLVKKLVDRYTIQYDSSKDGHVYVKGSKKWKKKQLEEAKNLKLEDFVEDRTQSFDGEDLQETGACDTLWDDYDAEEDSQEDALDIPMPPPPATCTPLYCLPLYSLLSSEKQRRVFEPPPEGTRMCVIATNVAETSLTIPGVKYVVDCGLYDPVTGVSKFVVDRISQASADQRAGRAGRIAAGHAYRVSAVILILCIQVINFPFPSPPNSETLEIAEERLIKLGALAKTTKDGKTEARITPLGRTLSVFPLAPAYAKVIAMANQHDLMPYAILLIAALSVREPLVPVSSIRGQTDEETKEKMTAVLKLRRGWCGKGPGRRLGDLLVLMRAVICYEEEKEFVFIDPCSVMYTDEPDYVIYQEIVQGALTIFEQSIKVMPLLAQFVTKMLAPPTTMVRSWAKLQKRTESLLNALVLKEVHTKAALVEEFNKNENYLLEEYLDWLPESLHGTVTDPDFSEKEYVEIVRGRGIFSSKRLACSISFFAEYNQAMVECASDLEKDARRLMDEFYSTDGPIKFRTAHLIDDWFCAALALCKEGFALADALSQTGLSKEMSKCVEGIPAFVEQVAQLFPTEAIFDVAMMLTDYPLKRLLRLRAQLYQSAIDFYHIVLVKEREDEKITMLQSALHSERRLLRLRAQLYQSAIDFYHIVLVREREDEKITMLQSALHSER